MADDFCRTHTTPVSVENFKNSQYTPGSDAGLHDAYQIDPSNSNTDDMEIVS
jgi:hypothetical protein